MHRVVINTCYGSFALSKKAIDWIAEREPDFFERYDIDEIPRHNPLLVQCVEELDWEADGRFSELMIVEIKGNAYRIEEYDGMERVIEPEDEKWIIINTDE